MCIIDSAMYLTHLKVTKIKIPKKKKEDEMKKLLMLVAVVAISTLVAFGQWQMVKEQTNAFDPMEGFFIDANTGWMFGNYNEVWKTENGGQDWTVARPWDSTTVWWRDIKFFDANVGYACGEKGYIFKTTDGGLNWSMIADTANYKSALKRMDILSADVVYFAGNDWTVLKTSNGGGTYAALGDSATFLGEDLDGGIDFTDENNGVVLADGNGGYTWYTHDGGVNWTFVAVGGLFPIGTSSTRIYDVAMIGSKVVITGYHYCVFISNDGGETYTLAGNDINYSLVLSNSISMINANTIFVGGGTAGHVMKTTDGGANWDVISTGSGQSMSFMHFVDANNGYVFLAGSQWFKTTDGGANYTSLFDWPAVSFWGLAFPSDDKIVLTSTSGGEMTVSNDGGITWDYPNNFATGFDASLYECEFIDANNGLIGGSSGDLGKTTDGGANWTLIDNAMYQGSNLHINMIQYVDANTVYAGGSKGHIMKSVDGGATWADATAGTQTIYDLWQIAADKIIATAGSGQIYNSTDGTAFTMAKDYGSMTMRAVEFRNGIGLVPASSGLLYRTTEADWDTLVAVFTDPDGDDLYDVEFVDDNLVFVVGNHGKIYRSEDAGLTWTADPAGTEETLQKVRYDGTNLWAVGQGGTILKREFNPMVTFQVDMSAQMDLGNFVDTTDYLDVAGSFNGWGANDRLTDEDGDSIYVGVFEIAPGAIEYKFRINGNWDTSEGVANRTYTVVDGEANVIPLVWYSDYDPNAIVDADVYFYADMNIQLLNGNFNPTGGDIAIIRGFPNGWAGEDFVLTESSTEPGIYTNHWTFDNLPLDVAQEFKFVIRKADNTDMWESSPNRSVTIPTGHSYLDTNSDGYYEVPTDTFFFANVGWDDVVQQDVTVYFQVNIESAVLALTAGEVLIDSQTDADTISSVDDIAGVYINGLLGSWWDWGSNPAAYLMTDDGLNGDAVAGDGIYTVGYTFTGGQAKSQTYKYGINSLDNEAGFAENRTMTIDDAAATYYPEADCFGSQNTDERLPFPEYGCPGVAIDGDLSALPTRFALHQNFPNPFNPTTQISFEMPMLGNVKLDIYNILGQKVRTLVSNDLNAGFHVYEWNALNDAGQGLSAGVYIYQLTAGDFVQQKKMLLLK